VKEESATSKTNLQRLAHGCKIKVRELKWDYRFSQCWCCWQFKYCGLIWYVSLLIVTDISNKCITHILQNNCISLPVNTAKQHRRTEPSAEQCHVCLHCLSHSYTIQSTTALCDSITVHQLIKTFIADKEHTFHCSIT